MSEQELPKSEATLDSQRYARCVGRFLYRIKGMRIRDFSDEDTQLLKASISTETDSAMVLSCAACAACCAKFAVSKNSDGTLSSDMAVGLLNCLPEDLSV